MKVDNAEYLIHGKKGNIDVINGDFQRISITITKTVINEQQALTKALVFVGARKYKWEDEGMERFIKQHTNNSKATFYPTGELMISKDYLKGTNAFRLSWKFIISSMEPANEQIIYVDANTGDIINNVPLLCNVNTTGTAQTLYSGNQTITFDSHSGGYRLFENRITTPGNSANIHTWNCLSGSNLSDSIEFSNTTANWTIGNWPAITQDQAALDAHWAEENISDFWSSRFNRNSIDNLGLDITGYVHYYKANTTAGWPNNAQWDGILHVMYYGDGDGSVFNSLTAIDIVAHEMGHGINQYTANLTGGYFESGALNEGFSDIWGT